VAVLAEEGSRKKTAKRTAHNSNAISFHSQRTNRFSR
jgi:hypothetical protein